MSVGTVINCNKVCVKISRNLSPSIQTNPLPFVSCIEEPETTDLAPSTEVKIQILISVQHKFKYPSDTSAAQLSILLEEKTHLKIPFKAIFPNTQESLLLNSQKQSVLIKKILFLSRDILLPLKSLILDISPTPVPSMAVQEATQRGNLLATRM